MIKPQTLLFKLLSCWDFTLGYNHLEVLPLYRGSTDVYVCSNTGVINTVIMSVELWSLCYLPVTCLVGYVNEISRFITRCHLFECRSGHMLEKYTLFLIVRSAWNILPIHYKNITSNININVLFQCRFGHIKGFIRIGSLVGYSWIFCCGYIRIFCTVIAPVTFLAFLSPIDWW